MKPILIVVQELQRHIALQLETKIVCTGLSAIEACVLASLYLRDGQKASELAVSVGRLVTSFTPILDRLERAGLVVRRADRVDRRAVTIWLTKSGEALRETITQALLDVESQMASELYDWLPTPVKSRSIPPILVDLVE